MNRRLAIFAVLTTSWLVVGCSDGSETAVQPASETSTAERVATTDSTTTTLGVVETALDGRTTGSFTGGAPCGEGGTEIITDGTGSSGEFGDFSYHATHCSLIERREITDGSIAFTFDDGDGFTASYTGTFASLDDPAAIPYSLDAVITDGSGRFDGASGSVTSDGVANALEGTSADTLSGTIRVRSAA